MASYILTEDGAFLKKEYLRTLFQVGIKSSERTTYTAFSKEQNYGAGEESSACLGVGPG